MFRDDYVWWLVFKGRDGCQRMSDVLRTYAYRVRIYIYIYIFVFYHTQIYTSSRNHGSFVMTQTRKNNHIDFIVLELNMPNRWVYKA